MLAFPELFCCIFTQACWNMQVLWSQFNIPLHITFHRMGFSFSIHSVMSSSMLYVFTTVFILKATLYWWHQLRIFISFSTWFLFPCPRPITLFVSSLNESHEMARMSRYCPAINHCQQQVADVFPMSMYMVGLSNYSKYGAVNFMQNVTEECTAWKVLGS